MPGSLSHKSTNTIKGTYFDFLNYTPHPAQKQIHDSIKRFIVAVCGRRFGKSLAMAMEVCFLLFNPALKNKRIWIVAPTYSLTDKIFRIVWGIFIARGYIRASIKSANTEQRKYIKMRWGSELECKSADNEKSLVGEELDLLIIDEAAKVKDRIWYQHLRPTLADRKGKVFFITTPEGKNWIHALFQFASDKLREAWDSFNFKSIENPYGGIRDEAESAKEELTEETYKQEWEADFVSRKGRVYKLFHYGSNVIKVIPAKFDEIVLGMDYGFNNPTVILVIGILDGRYYVIDEVYRTGMLLEDIICELKRLKKTYNYRKLYPDVKPEYNKPLKSAGFNVINVKKDVTAGIEKVSQMMKVKRDGKPSFFVKNTCVHTIAEHENYHYAESKYNQNDKEEPVKDDDHTCDAARYAIFTRETKTTTSFRHVKGVYG